MRQWDAAVKADMAVAEQQQEQEPSRRKGQAWPTGQHQQLQGAVGNRQRALAAAPRATAPGACSKAFRPPGQAPPPQHLNRQRQPAKPPVPRPMPVHDQLAALRQENAEMREHLSTLLSHFKQQLDSAAAASAAASASDMHLRPAHLALRSLRRQPAVHHVAGLGSSMQLEPGSPGRTTAVVLSPRAGGADLAVAVFEVRQCRVHLGSADCGFVIRVCVVLPTLPSGSRAAPLVCPLGRTSRHLRARQLLAPGCHACAVQLLSPRYHPPCHNRDCSHRQRMQASCGWLSTACSGRT